MLLPKCALIRAAVFHVNRQQKGASLVQVRKHLEATYDEKVDTKKKKLIHTTFKTLIQEGKLLRKGTIYKSTKARAIARVRADVPQQRHRKRHHRRRRHSRRRKHRRRRSGHHHRGHHHGRHHHGRRHLGRHHHRSRHHKRHQNRSRHHKRHHHGSRHHKKHHSRRHHQRHHHDWHHHCSRHHRQYHEIDVKKSIPQYKNPAVNALVDVPMDKLALSPTTSKVSQQTKA